MRKLSRGDRNIRWIEKYCRVPNTHQGEPVRLSDAERVVVGKLYDAPGGPRDDVPVPKPLSAFVTLLHLCGPEALQENFRPAFEIDSWTVWGATSVELQAVLKRQGQRILCPELGTAFELAA